MKLLLLFGLFLTACASFSPSFSDRQIASRKNLEDQTFNLSLSQDLVVANGINQVQLTITASDLNSPEFEIITSIETELSEIVATQNGYVVSITPRLKSPNIKIFVNTKNSQSQIVVLKTTLLPLKEKMLPLKWGPSNNSSVNGLNVTRQDNFPEGQYEGFAVRNNGNNRIVNTEDAGRDFSFDFEEQARQNISILVTDAPNGTTSHTMYSEFILFPRLIIPYAQIQKNEDTLVTLTNGEEIRFNKDGEIIDGVFEEGPVDVGPDRFTRTYANLKYHGKGILLRGNARGQMPQQGQFEATKIDMDYGIKYSSDVLIINGTTGQRCRRPKNDFWNNADVTPIEFKFPSDAEFDAYLKANCKFGIPDMALETNLEGEDISTALVPLIWQGCKNDPQIKSCLDAEIQKIPNKDDQSRVKFEMKRLLFKAKQEEAETIDSKVSAEINAIRPKLLTDLKWISSATETQIKEDCVAQSLALNTLTFRFNNAPNLMRPGLTITCSSIKDDLDQKANVEVKSLIDPLAADFSWVNLSNGQNFNFNCQKEFLKRYTNLNFQKALGMYTTPLAAACSQIENSSEFQVWLSTQSLAVEGRLFLQVQNAVSTRTEAKAQTCLADFPMNTALNRLRFKKQREACLIDAWPAIEAGAVAEAKKDPIAQKVGISETNLILRLDKDRRLNQLKLIKKYFMQ